jgi:hypothetical protein
MRLSQHLRHAIERLGPYPSLIVLAVPLAIVEPLKLVAVLVAGAGHWLTGLIVMLCAYGGSLFITERLFVIVKPKLLRLRWFRKFWTWFVAVRDTVTGWLRRRWARISRSLRGASASGF